MHSLKISRTEKDQKNNKSKFRRPSNFAGKVTVKGRSEKVWLLYQFPFSLNPSDKPSDAQTRNNYSSLYPVITEDQLQANSKKNW